jgi:hypothetical protein
MDPVLEHAARVLDHLPTRSMEADRLYRQTVRDTGAGLTFRRFMDAMMERTDHFAVIPAAPGIGMTEGWDLHQRSQYAAAMEAAGMTQPLIVLAVPPADPAGEHADGAPSPAATFDVFRDAHDALTHLLHSADPADPLHSAVRGAMEELHTARRLLGS